MTDPTSALRALGGNPDGGATGLPNIPAVPATADSSLNNILASMKLWMEKASGSGFTGFASKDELIRAGILRRNADGTITAGGGSLAIPPVPTGLTASGAMTTILVAWDNPMTAYGNHGYTEVWAAETDNFTNAVLIGQGAGFVFSHAVGEDSTRYYWIRFVSTSGVKGPFNSVNGTLGQTAKDPAFLMSVLTEEYGYGSAAPFFQVDAPITINGVAVPAGTYMKTAFIADASINNAKIGSLAADKITTGTLAADRIGANTITAAKMATRTITANSAVIDNAAITNALIADAAITTAKLGDASVNTLKIEGNAVTIPVSSSSTNHVSIVSIDCGTEGLTVCVMATTSGYITPPDGVTTHYLVGTLYRNGVAIASTNFASGSFAYSGRPGFGVCSFNTTISGLTGVNTFTVQISGAVGSDSWGGGRSGIIALGVKR